MAFLAAAWKAAKVLDPLAGALMAPTIPGHDVNIKDWDSIDQTKFTGETMGSGQKLLAEEPKSYR